jgi:hypothetical protein
MGAWGWAETRATTGRPTRDRSSRAYKIRSHTFGTNYSEPTNEIAKTAALLPR